MMYRKPTLSIRDRHVLIELDMDKHDEYDVRHLLNHAYLNHKAPHEYDDLKRFIRDIALGRHNSVYIMNNGSPNPYASAFILGSPYLTYAIAPQNFDNGTNFTLYYDFISTQYNSGCTYYEINLTNNSSNCNSSSLSNWNSYAYPYNAMVNSINIVNNSYNNGLAIMFSILYLPVTFNKATSPSSSYLLITPYASSYPIPAVLPKYAYAPYISTTNPLTLSAYLFWENASGSSFSSNYVYFAVVFSWSVEFFCNPSSPAASKAPIFMPLFYSSGNYNFSGSNYYISMWQWVYQ